jgi:hypothetical protein
MLHIAHVDKEFINGGFEVVVGWIKEDLLAGEKNLEQIHNFYNMYTFGPEKKRITEDEFFLAYKSAEMVCQDAIAFQKKKKDSQMFRRK